MSMPSFIFNFACGLSHTSVLSGFASIRSKYPLQYLLCSNLQDLAGTSKSISKMDKSNKTFDIQFRSIFLSTYSGVIDHTTRGWECSHLLKDWQFQEKRRNKILRVDMNRKLSMDSRTDACIVFSFHLQQNRPSPSIKKSFSMSVRGRA